MRREIRWRGAPLIGLHTVWNGEKLPRSIRVEAATDAWIWGAPLPDGGYAISVFHDPRGGRSEGDLVSRVARVVARSEILKGARDLRMMDKVTGHDATPTGSEVADQTLRLFRVGDAALTLDPLSSSGVQCALQSAVDCALAIHTLSQNQSTVALVTEFLNRRSSRRAARHTAYAADFYDMANKAFPTLFWLARASPAPSPPRVVVPNWDCRIVLGAEAQVRTEPCPVGDRIVARRVVCPPGSAEPVAIVDGVEVAPLFDLIPPDATPGIVVRVWSAIVGEPLALRLFSWAWRAGLLEQS